jgi:hypothetical protein
MKIKNTEQMVVIMTIKGQRDWPFAVIVKASSKLKAEDLISDYIWKNIDRKSYPVHILCFQYNTEVLS